MPYNSDGTAMPDPEFVHTWCQYCHGQYPTHCVLILEIPVCLACIDEIHGIGLEERPVVNRTNQMLMQVSDVKYH